MCALQQLTMLPRAHTARPAVDAGFARTAILHSPARIHIHAQGHIQPISGAVSRGVSAACLGATARLSPASGQRPSELTVTGLVDDVLASLESPARSVIVQVRRFLVMLCLHPALIRVRRVWWANAMQIYLRCASQPRK